MSTPAATCPPLSNMSTPAATCPPLYNISTPAATCPPFYISTAPDACPALYNNWNPAATCPPLYNILTPATTWPPLYNISAHAATCQPFYNNSTPVAICHPLPNGTYHHLPQLVLPLSQVWLLQDSEREKKLPSDSWCLPLGKTLPPPQELLAGKTKMQPLITFKTYTNNNTLLKIKTGMTKKKMTPNEQINQWTN